MDQASIDVYEQRAAQWNAERAPASVARAEAFGAITGHPVLDLGCGPGWFTTALDPSGAIALDAAGAMLDLVATHAPSARRVRADLARLPFRRGSLGGTWAAKSYVHVPRPQTPLALADLHHAMAVGAPVNLTAFAGDADHQPFADDAFPGRRFSLWTAAQLTDVLTGAGFTDISVHGGAESTTGRDEHIVEATRARTLPDTVGPDMRLLIVGLNPSLNAADAGVGFAFNGNRYWPAALAAGLVTRDRDPDHALRAHGIGMTDVVKRATARADELHPDEYRVGLARLERLVRWLQPGAVCFVGLAGWRAAVDRKAKPGVQPTTLGGRPAYVMPSTSGLNARSTPADLAQHLRNALVLAGNEGE